MGGSCCKCTRWDIRELYLVAKSGCVMRKTEDSPLYFAAMNDHAKVAEWLLRHGVCDFVNQSPLVVAIEKGSTEVVEVILKHSREIYEKLTEDGKSLQENAKSGAILVQLKSCDGQRTCISAELLWTERITPLEIRGYSSGYTPLAQAAFSTDLRIVQLLLNVAQCMYSETDIMDSFRSIVDNVQMNLKKPQAIECSPHFRIVLRFLMDSSKFNVNHQDEELNTFLHHVMRQKSKQTCGCLTEASVQLRLVNQIVNDVTLLLLEKGADVNLKNSRGETPLMVASERGRCDAIQTLFDWEVKSGMKLDLNARDRYGESALIKAVQWYRVTVVQLLLKHHASLSLHDYRGFTALHTAVFDLNKNWLDFYLISKVLSERKFNNEEYCFDELEFRREVNIILIHRKEAIRTKEEIVRLLLANDETNVNGIDFRGNTPLDLAVKSSKQITSATLRSLVNCGAIHNLLETEDESPIEVGDQTPTGVAWVDERGRNSLHRLIISLHSRDERQYAVLPYQRGHNSGYVISHVQFHNIISNYLNYLFLQQPENFNETDDKGRTPLHYAALSDDRFHSPRDLVNVLLELGSNVNATDIYEKTPLHYAEGYITYGRFVHNGADEDAKDKDGYTPKDLKKLRQSVTLSEDNAAESTIGLHYLRPRKLRDITRVCSTFRVTELTKRKVIETIRINCQSIQPRESSEEAIWKIWTKSELILLNRRLSQLKPLMDQFMERLANGIKKKDGRLECQPILVGSACEETKVVISGDFDFNFKLIKFSQLCDAFPQPLGPKGYFQLRRKSCSNAKTSSEINFESFFNSDQCLLTNEVNSRFKITLEEVISDHNFWRNEHLFEMHMKGENSEKFPESGTMCKTLKLRMIRPIDDGEGGFLFVNISVDIVACVEVDAGSWFQESQPVGTSSVLNCEGCTFVFDRPLLDPFRLHVSDVYFPFSETFARISFAPLESRIIRETSPVIKAAYMVCKLILYREQKTTYLLKTCLLFCMEALNTRSKGDTRNEDNTTPKLLAFWVERIIFCCMEFCRHNIVYPCYFMPTFEQRVSRGFHECLRDRKNNLFMRYCVVYGIYLGLCPDETAIVDIPVHSLSDGLIVAKYDAWLEQFDREEFIRILSSRRFVS